MDDRREKIMGMDERQWREFVDDQMRASEERQMTMHEALQTNTDLTKSIDESTKELVSIFKAGKTGVGFFKWCANLIRGLAGFLYPMVLLGGAIAALKTGEMPKWIESIKGWFE